MDKFEELMGLVKRANTSLLDDYFTTSFVSGLKDYIQHHLQCHKPGTLTEAFWFAKRLEQATPAPRRYLPPNANFKPVRQWTPHTEGKEPPGNSIAELKAAG